MFGAHAAPGHWVTRVMQLSALRGQGIEAFWAGVEEFHRLRRVFLRHRAAIDAYDRVAGLDAAALSRRVVDRRNHAQYAVDRDDLKAEAVVAAARVLGDCIHALLIEILAVRIKIAEQAADRRLHQGLVVDRLDIGLLDQREHGGERSDILDIDRLFLRRARCCLSRRLRRLGLVGVGVGGGPEDQGDGGGEEFAGHSAKHLQTVAARLYERNGAAGVPDQGLSQVFGSTGLPCVRSSKYTPGVFCPPVAPLAATTSLASTQSPTSLSRVSLWPYRLI